MKDARMKTKRSARAAPKGKHDWRRADAMTDEEVYKAALRDPDARPLTPADTARMKRTPRVKVIRRALNLSQQQFADCYGIPVGTLRDWEQGRVEPDKATRSYLKVIARDPAGVALLHKPDAPRTRAASKKRIAMIVGLVTDAYLRRGREQTNVINILEALRGMIAEEAKVSGKAAPK